MKKIRNHWLLATSIFWLAYLIAHVSLVGRIWFWNVTSIIPPFIFFIVSFLLLIVLLTSLIKRVLRSKSLRPRVMKIRRTEPCVLLVIALAIFISFPISDINIAALYNSEGHSFDESQAITIFNWNTQFWETEGSRDELISFLQKQKADIYHLQEFGLSASMYRSDDRLLTFHEREVEFLEEAFPGYNIYYQNDLLTLSRFPIIDEEIEEDVYWVKLNLDIRGSIISFYNVHIPVHFFGDSTLINDVKNKFELRNKYFRSLEKSISNNSHPYFISGDFNSTKAMGVMNRILECTEDSYGVSNRLLPATWQTGPFRLWRIDYSLISKNRLTFITHEDVNPNGMSDHWGQRVTVRLP